MREGGVHLKTKPIFLFLLLTLVLTACSSVTTTKETTKEASNQSTKVHAVITITQQDHQDILSKKEVAFTEGATLLEVMNEHFELTTAYDGTFITGIDGVLAKEDEQYAWIYYLNGEPAMKGAAELVLNAGDEIQFSLEKWQ